MEEKNGTTFGMQIEHWKYIDFPRWGECLQSAQLPALSKVYHKFNKMPFFSNINELFSVHINRVNAHYIDVNIQLGVFIFKQLHAFVPDYLCNEFANAIEVNIKKMDNNYLISFIKWLFAITFYNLLFIRMCICICNVTALFLVPDFNFHAMNYFRWRWHFSCICTTYYVAVCAYLSVHANTQTRVFKWIYSISKY